jgi:Isochorismatase family
MTPALILVDIQNDFLPGGELAVPDGHAVIPVANRLSPHFDCVVATQDWHPANHGSFAKNHLGRKPGELIVLGGLSQVLWPAHCVQNTPGADFAKELDTTQLVAVFRKGTDPEIDSYSGFFDNGHKQATGPRRISERARDARGLCARPGHGLLRKVHRPGRAPARLRCVGRGRWLPRRRLEARRLRLGPYRAARGRRARGDERHARGLSGSGRRRSASRILEQARTTHRKCARQRHGRVWSLRSRLQGE